MSEKIKQTLLDRGLDIAEKLQNEILFGKPDFEKNLHGFLTVAELLNRKEDIEWAKGELLGFQSNVPEYRKLDCKFSEKGKLVYKNEIPFFGICDVILPITQLEHSMNDKKDIIEYIAEETTVQKFEKEIGRKLIGQVNIVYTKPRIKTIFGGAKVELISRLNSMINEIAYGKIPRSIFKKFQDKVNLQLSKSNPSAVSELNIAVESLGHSEDSERISHVAHACKRLIKAVADQVFPPKNEDYTMKDGTSKKIGGEQYLNRLEAFVDSVDSPNRKFILRKIKFLRDLYGETPESINRGTHEIISNQAAEMAVIYSYLILGEIVLEGKPK